MNEQAQIDEWVVQGGGEGGLDAMEAAMGGGESADPPAAAGAASRPDATAPPAAETTPPAAEVQTPPADGGEQTPPPAQEGEQQAGGEQQQAESDGFEVNDETKFIVGKDADGKDIETSAGEVVDALTAYRQVGEATGAAALKMPDVSESVRDFNYSSIEGYAQADAEVKSIQERAAPIAQQIQEKMGQVVAKERSLLDMGDDFDMEFATRTQVEMSSLNREIAGLRAEYSQLEGRVRSVVDEMSARSAAHVDALIGEVWPEYADQSKREGLLREMAADVNKIYGMRADEVSAGVRRDPRLAPLMRDALAYRKLSAGATGSITAAVQKAAGKAGAAKPSNVLRFTGKQMKSAGGAPATDRAGGGQPGGIPKAALDKVAAGDHSAADEHLARLMGF